MSNFLLTTTEAYLLRLAQTAANSSTISFNVDKNISVFDMVIAANVGAVISWIAQAENDELSDCSCHIESVCWHLALYSVEFFNYVSTCYISDMVTNFSEQLSGFLIFVIERGQT